ncbi:MAG: hypothetical protein WCD35_08330 [Mycobacteriales bacterium]
MTEPGTDEPDLAPGTDVEPDLSHLERHDATLTTDPGQLEDDLDSNEGEEGSA